MCETCWIYCKTCHSPHPVWVGPRWLISFSVFISFRFRISVTFLLCLNSKYCKRECHNIIFNFHSTMLKQITGVFITFHLPRRFTSFLLTVFIFNTMPQILYFTYATTTITITPYHLRTSIPGFYADYYYYELESNWKDQLHDPLDHG